MSLLWNLLSGRLAGPPAALALAALMGACASSTAPTPAAPEATLTGAGEVITARATCRQTVYATSVAPDQWRGSAISCDVSSADPRVAGTQIVHVNLNILDDRRAFLWGTARLETAGGTWEGSYAAFAEAPYPDGTHHIGAVMTGTGGYAGLRLLATWTTDPATDDYEVLAWIEPA